ncbi:MAG: hypothetical protein N2Z20_04790 [Elusimicrobiales bacterium]|nr:hypothetical protein [Elusimicrobiales bacterium]
MNNRFSILDFIVIIFGFLLLFFIGYIKKSLNNNENDFYLASKKSGILKVVLAFVSTEISALTIIGVPSASFSGSWSYLQFFLGSAISRILIAYLFIPVFYNYNCITIYEFIGKRFSSPVRVSSSMFFFITRVFASGIRLYAAAMTISVMFEVSLFLTIFIFVLVSLLFISWGGMRSVLSNGAYQAVVFYITGAMIIFFALKMSGYNFITAAYLLNDAGKLNIINISIDLKKFDTFILAFLNGIFGSFASFGTDYEMMQKLLTLETRKKSQQTILLTIFASFLLVIVYLFAGSLIYLFFQSAHINYIGNPDEIVAYFTINFIDTGFKGLVFLTVFLATVDLPLLSLSTSFVNDVYRVFKKNISEAKSIKMTRLSMLIFAVLLSIIAYMCKDVKGILWFGFEVHGITAGSLLGIFLIGILTKKQFSSNSLILSMIISSGLCLLFMIFNRKGITHIPWSSFVILGSLISFFLPWFLEYLNRKIILKALLSSFLFLLLTFQ